MQTWKHALARGDEGSATSVAGLSRRDVLRLGGTAAAGTALAGLLPGVASAAPAATPRDRSAPRRASRFTDEPVTAETARARWEELGVVGDARGTYVHATPTRDWANRQTSILHGGTPRLYSLGEPMYPGIPAFPNTPPRRFDMYVNGYGPVGANQLSFMEERFAAFTYQQATQVDELNHIGIGDLYYGGASLAAMIPLWDQLQDPLARQARAAADSSAANYGEDSILGGTSTLGVEHAGPLHTRGVLLDVLTLKQREGDAGALSADGETLAGGYRITVDDMLAAMEMGRIRSIEPGDVVVLRTGWSRLWADPSRWGDYLASEPGIWMAEGRWLAQFRPAIIASDTWALEVLPAPDPTRVFEVHQLLLTQEGIRIGEAFVSEELAADEVYEFVFINTPPTALGATATNNAPAALGVPRRGRR